MNGIIPLYKPRGMTSFDCVRKLRKILNIKKIGHSGTLDPDVDGVLPICIGRATKVVDLLMLHNKTYQGSITLGFSTTTGDLEGSKIDEKLITSPLSNAEIDSEMNNMTGNDILQIPPMYSAIKVNGKKLYEYARAHQTVKRPKRYINVKSFKQIAPYKYNQNNQQQTIYFKIQCSKGTYIRTIAIDFGKKFNIPAVMSNLRRLLSGGFDISKTVTFDDIKIAMKNNKLNQIIKPIDTILTNYTHDDINKYQWKRVKNGAFLYPDELKHNDKKIVIKYENTVKAIYYYDSKIKKYKPLKMISNK